MFEIRFNDGDEVRNIETYEMALACIRGVCPGVVFGKSSRPYCTLCWENEQDAESNDESLLVAVIKVVPL